jgi:hypothetical protein
VLAAAAIVALAVAGALAGCSPGGSQLEILQSGVARERLGGLIVDVGKGGRLAHGSSSMCRIGDMGVGAVALRVLVHPPGIDHSGP